MNATAFSTYEDDVTMSQIYVMRVILLTDDYAVGDVGPFGISVRRGGECMCLCVSVFVSVSLSLCVCLSVSLCLSLCLSVSVSLSLSLSLSLPLSLSLCLSLSLSLSLSLPLPLPLSLPLSLSLSCLSELTLPHSLHSSDSLVPSTPYREESQFAPLQQPLMRRERDDK